MKRLFRSRLPPPLTPTQISTLTREAHLTSEDLAEWYERFNHCYPRGYLSYKEFLNYLQQLNTPKTKNPRPKPSMLKQLFRTLDLNEDKQLNFDEFILFNTLINRDSSEKKLKLILNLYDREKTKYLTREQLENVLTNMFDLLDIPQPTNGLTRRIDTILTQSNLTDQETKISWHAFRTSVLNDRALFQLLLANDDDDDDDWSVLITRF